MLSRLRPILLLASLGVWPGLGADYLGEIKPLLTEHCVTCHGAEHAKGGLRLDTAAAARQGGDHGPAVSAGNAAESLLIQALEDRHSDVARMPYKKPPLAAGQIAQVRAWIDAGAKAPADEVPGRRVHWAFVAPRRPVIPVISRPEVSNQSVTAKGPSSLTTGSLNTEYSHPIDALIRARLIQESVVPSAEADRVTLLRRVHLDLTGLPPTPAQVEAFVADTRPDAYERVVEELLASPHYGERWARWWLDVARYADSNGYSIDAPRSIWPWRDWVIEAFNDDKPFNEFVIEQLAGDLLPDATLEQRIATGFHRNTQINEEGGIDPEQFRIESVIDRVNTTGTAFLGLTVSCAQCHDHKFDPLSQREYFQLFAFFNQQDEPTLELPTPEQQADRDAHAAEVKGLESKLAALKDSTETGADKHRDELKRELERLRRNRPRANSTLVLSERGEPRDCYVFIKGDFTRRGADVAPGTPAVLHPFPQSANRQGLPNRLDLARWLTAPANPLTARVTVNRVWQQYFGRGLVETENDFGTQGSPPTHPDLLDWLAVEFREGVDRKSELMVDSSKSGETSSIHYPLKHPSTSWSLKHLHRLIVTSATYRQSSKARPDLVEKDPTNKLLARQNRLRLDAEIVRDVALAASGRLNPAIGGPSVFPPQPDGVMSLGQSNREWKASTGGDRFRRGMYSFFWRATPHPALAVFDAPDAFSACTRRLRSNTPLQALTLLNDAAFVELADALAQRIQAEAPEPQRLEFGFRLCTGRAPHAAEKERLKSLLDEEAREGGTTKAWQTFARVLLNLDETITRE